MSSHPPARQAPSMPIEALDASIHAVFKNLRDHLYSNAGTNEAGQNAVSCADAGEDRRLRLLIRAEREWRALERSLQMRLSQVQKLETGTTSLKVPMADQKHTGSGNGVDSTVTNVSGTVVSAGPQVPTGFLHPSDAHPGFSQSPREIWRRLLPVLEDLDEELRFHESPMADLLKNVKEQIGGLVRAFSLPSSARPHDASDSSGGMDWEVTSSDDESHPNHRVRKSPIQSRSSSYSKPIPPSRSQRLVMSERLASEALMLRELISRPEQILRPGKSLDSVFKEAVESGMSGHPPRAEDDIEDDGELGGEGVIEDRESWVKAKEIIWSTCGPLILPSDSGSPAKVRRWQTEREDIREAFDPSSTSSSSEVFSHEVAVAQLKALTSFLSRLCAPIRDPKVREIESTISNFPSWMNISQLLYELSQDVIHLGTLMRLDLMNLGDAIKSAEMSEHVGGLIGRDRQRRDGDRVLEGLLVEESRRRERDAVRSYLGGEELAGSEDRARGLTDAWVGSHVGGEEGGLDWTDGEGWRKQVTVALLDTVFEDTAVGIPPPTSPPPPPSQTLQLPTATATAPSTPDPSTKRNDLPPIFLVSSPKIFRLQNKVQLLVILACLISVVGLPASNGVRGVTRGGNDEWIGRVAVLLEEAANEPSSQSHVQGSEQSADGESRISTKISHLADEIISYRKASSASASSPASLEGRQEEGDDSKLRSTISRILRYDDPVFKLLKNRLQKGISEHLTSPDPDRAPDVPVGAFEPMQIRTGRGAGAGAGAPSPSRSRPLDVRASASERLSVKGFDRPDVLVDRVGDVISDVRELVGWAELAWFKTL